MVPKPNAAGMHFENWSPREPEGKAVAKPPPPLRRNGVDSPHLPACMLHAPGDPAVIAPEEGR